MKLLYRFTIVFGLLLIIVTGISAYLIHSVMLDNLISQQKKELKTKGEIWIEKMGTANTIEEKDIEELNRLVLSNRKIEILLLEKRKKVLYTTLPSTNLQEWIQRIERKAQKKQEKNKWMIGKNEYIVVTLGLHNDGKQKLLLATPVRGVKDIWEDVTHNFTVTLIIGAICAIILSFFITRSLVYPLRRLTIELKKVHARRFSEVQRIRAQGEIAEVTEGVYFLAQELDRFQNIQKQFLQNASHELKTPLMSIQGYAEGIRDGVFTGEAVNKGLNVIVEETTRLKNIVTEMILLAKLESEQDIIHPEEVDVIDLINEAIERMQPMIVRKGVHISVQIEHDGRKACIVVDRGKLLQAVMNLLGNALRYTTNYIEIKISTSDRQVVMEMADNGAGIPDELLPHLFHRFVKGKDGETGLGLAITRAIIERSGGMIEAKNLANAGALFQITIPR